MAGKKLWNSPNIQYQIKKQNDHTQQKFAKLAKFAFFNQFKQRFVL